MEALAVWAIAACGTKNNCAAKTIVAAVLPLNMGWVSWRWMDCGLVIMVLMSDSEQRRDETVKKAYAFFVSRSD